MGMNTRKTRKPTSAEEVIKAFDRERDTARELNRRHREFVTNARRDDQQYKTNDSHTSE